MLCVRGLHNCTEYCIFNLIKKFNRSKNCLKQKDRLEMDKQQIMMGMMPGCPMRQVTPYSPNTRRDLAARGELTLEVPSLAALCDEHGQPKPFFSDVCMIADLEWRLELRKINNDNDPDQAIISIPEIPQFNLFVHCNQQCQQHYWFCEAKFGPCNQSTKPQSLDLPEFKPVLHPHHPMMVMAQPQQMMAQQPQQMITQQQQCSMGMGQQRMMAQQQQQCSMLLGPRMLYPNPNGSSSSSSNQNQLYFPPYVDHYPTAMMHNRNKTYSFMPQILSAQFPVVIKVEAFLLMVHKKMFTFDANIEVRLANGSRKVPINKNGLAYLSDYFRILHEQGMETGDEAFVIEEGSEDFDFDTFQLMIHSALALPWMLQDLVKLIGEKRIFALLKMSLKYDILPLAQYCENYLIEHVMVCPPNMEMLELADQMNRERLRRHCLAKIDPMIFAQNMAQNSDIRTRLGKRTRDELDKNLMDYTKRPSYTPMMPNSNPTAAVPPSTSASSQVGYVPPPGTGLSCITSMRPSWNHLFGAMK